MRSFALPSMQSHCFMVNQNGASPVSSDKEAQYFLASFGYLKPELKNTSTASVAIETMRNAISDFQSYVGLDPTGILDEETLTWMGKPRCGFPDRIIPEGSSTRRKRSFNIDGGDQWTKNDLTYGISKYTQDLGKSVVDREIARAFRLWEEVTPLTFTFVERGNVDIEISFESGSHSDIKGDNPFEGPGEVLAHAVFVSSGIIIHFDEAEIWIVGNGTNLFQVATHEFGHALGLVHSEVKTAVMYSYYDYRLDFKLETDDINRIQQSYGPKIDRWFIDKFKAIANEMRELKEELNETKKKLTEAKKTIEDLKTSNGITGDIKNNDGKMPTSCEDLESMGQRSSGIFLVKGTPNATIDAVFCSFNARNKKDSQKWIGHVDVKSAPVYFYVQRYSPFHAIKYAISFDVARVNIGNAMNLQSGIFMAPKSGTYFFSFTGLACFPETKSPDLVQLGVGLYLNGDLVGSALAEESNTVDNQKCPLSLQSTLKLVTNEAIWLQIDIKSTPDVFLFDGADPEQDRHWTHFTGWMLEEEIFDPL